jgi:peptidyl-prolyl cis-trans isomerase SurA
MLQALCLSVTYAGRADRIVAVVNDQIILESQVATAVDYLQLQLPLTDSARQPPESLLQRQVLDQLINDQVILEQAKLESVTVTKDQVDAELTAALKNLKTRFGHPDSFTRALAREGLTESGLRRRYRQEITQRLTAQLLLAKHNLLENITVSPTEVKQFYLTHQDSFGSIPGRVRLAHILIIPKPSEQQEQQAYGPIVQAYIGLVQSGWDFEAIATSFSTDEEVKRKAGLIGLVERGELPEEVDSVLFQLKPGEFSKPFRSRLGWEIIKREKGTGKQAFARVIRITVRVTKEDTSRARDLAADLRKKASGGEDFASLAREYSDDPATKANGGLLGEFFIQGLVPPYSNAVESLKTGEISRPIQSEHGFHIIKVLERVDEKVPTYEELQEEIRSYLNNQKLKAKLDELVKEYSAHISVKRFN